LVIERFWLCSEALSCLQLSVCQGEFVLQQPEWIVDVSAYQKLIFFTESNCQSLWYQSGVCVPVIVNHQVLAVLDLFFMTQVCQEDHQRLIELMQRWQLNQA